MDYRELIAYLQENGNEKASLFSEKIIPTNLKFLGASTPFIKALAKRIIKDNIDTSTWILGQYFDVDFLLINIAMQRKGPLEEKYAFLEHVLPKVDNWAIIDSACDIRTKNYLLARPFIQKCLASPYPFMRRFGYVHYLANFIEKEYLIDIFANFQNDDHYYVQMIEAWLLSVLMVKYPLETEQYLQNNNLSKEIINKAIQKMRDSYRISNEIKERLLKYKK